MWRCQDRRRWNSADRSHLSLKQHAVRKTGLISQHVLKLKTLSENKLCFPVLNPAERHQCPLAYGGHTEDQTTNPQWRKYQQELQNDNYHFFFFFSVCQLRSMIFDLDKGTREKRCNLASFKQSCLSEVVKGQVHTTNTDPDRRGQYSQSLFKPIFVDLH